MSTTQTTTRAPPAAVAKPVDKAIVPGDKPLKRYTREEVAKHNKEGDVVRLIDHVWRSGADCLLVVGYRRFNRV
jgi:hypothetical protein